MYRDPDVIVVTTIQGVAGKVEFRDIVFAGDRFHAVVRYRDTDFECSVYSGTDHGINVHVDYIGDPVSPNVFHVAVLAHATTTLYYQLLVGQGAA